MHVNQSGPQTPRVMRLAPRKDIQGLRAVAVMLVVLAHAGVPFLSGGFIGVDVFFVVSGFLITQLLVRETTRSGTVSLARFYARRARRILPVSTLVLLVTSVVAGLTLSASRAQEVVEDVLWSSAFVANVHFAQLDTDYFSADRAVSPVQHYWSLAVEEQFYLVLPLIFVLLVVLGRREMGAGKRYPGRQVAAVAVGVLALASLVWSIVGTSLSPSTAYFSSLTRGWELGVGVVLALAIPQLSKLAPRTRRVLGALGLLAILGSAVAYGSGTPFPGWQALVPVLGTAAVLAAGVDRDGQGAVKPLTWRPVTWVGDLSYSIYLWHWPALVLGAPLLTGDDPEWLEKSVLLGAVVALSMLSYHLVEQPFRRGRVPGTRNQMALVLWPVSVGAVVLSTLWVTSYGEAELRQRAVEAQEYYDDLDPSGAEVAATSMADLVEESVALADEDAPIHFPVTNLDGLHDDHWAEAYPCFAAFRDTTAPFCELGDPDADRTVVAFGDSHMGMWLPALDAIGSSDGFRVVPFVKWACASIDVPTPTTRGAEETCGEFRAWATEQIRELDPDVILLSNRVLPPNLEADDDDLLDVWEAGLRSTLETMGEIAPTSVFSDVPRVDVDPGDCLSESDSTMDSCTVVPSERSVQGIIATRTTAEEVGAPVVNVAPLTCFEQRCPLAVDQTAVYRDEDHISMTWSRRLTDDLRERLSVALGGS
jgi:peptidoglycan/LPS O-acetylase OafA/YrhL